MGAIKQREPLNPQNGFLLLANLDILFEKGFVSFDDDGRMLVSKELSATDRRVFGLPKNLRRKPDQGERLYLAHHRRMFKFERQAAKQNWRSIRA
jgi:hypothetical protein